MAYIGNAPVAGAFKKLDNIVFDGTTTTFPITVATTLTAAGTAQNLIISVSSVLQEPGVAYTVSGSNIIFSEAPLITDTFFGVLLGSVGEVTGVSDGVVTAAKLATNSVSTAKIVDNSVTAAKLADASVELNTATVTGILPVTLGGTGGTTAATARTELGAQATLVSGTNIKTVNSASLVGSGDLVVGDVTQVGVQTLTNKTITETVFAVTGTTPALTATNGAVQTWALTAASTPTSAMTSGQSIILIVTPVAFTITWPSVVWTKQGGSGVAPTLFSSGKTTVILWVVGATLYGSHLGDTV